MANNYIPSTPSSPISTATGNAGTTAQFPSTGGYWLKFWLDEFLELIDEAKPSRVYQGNLTTETKREKMNMTQLSSITIIISRIFLSVSYQLVFS